MVAFAFHIVMNRVKNALNIPQMKTTKNVMGVKKDIIPQVKTQIIAKK